MMKSTKNSFTLFLALSAFLGGCRPSLPDHINLNDQQWIHGSAKCEENTDPLIQVVQYNKSTWIFRQNKCANYEAPFMFLFMGADKALLIDTGATEGSESFPLRQTIDSLVAQWEEAQGNPVELVVAHTHNHGDHHAGDPQFVGRPNTTLVGLEVQNVRAFFNFTSWPEEAANFELGERTLTIIPIPGHEASSIAIYDASSKLLLTGDTFYPGRLYVSDWVAFKQSITRLSDFAAAHDISYILGNHIEMTSVAGRDYPTGTKFQPSEHKLPLTVEDLKALDATLLELGDQPVRKVLDSFIIYPVN